MKDVKFIRKGSKIQDVSTGEWQHFASISKAKAWSKDWQLKNGGLGCACGSQIRVEV